MIINNWKIDITLSSLENVKTGEVRRLGEYQLKLLLELIDKPNTVLSRSQLTKRVWSNRIVGSNSLPVAMNAIRSAIDDNGNIIKTIPKLGYILDSSFLIVDKKEPKIFSKCSQQMIVAINNQTFLIGDRDVILPLVMATSFNNNSSLH